MLWYTPTATYYLLLARLSIPLNTMARLYTPGKATICTSSLVSIIPVRFVSVILIHDAGLGLGSILSRAKSVTDTMVEAASLGLAESLTPEEHEAGLLYPKIERSEFCRLSCVRRLVLMVIQ